jgi:hypothetical protein
MTWRTPSPPPFALTGFGWQATMFTRLADRRHRVVTRLSLIDDPHTMREHVARSHPKRRRGTTPKRPRPSRGKAQAEPSKSACTQRLRNNTPAGKPGTPRRNSLVHDSQPDDLQARRPNAVCISPGVNGSAIIDNPRSLKFVGKNKSKNKKHCVNFYLQSVPKMKGL